MSSAVARLRPEDDALVERHLAHLRVERRLAPTTLRSVGASLDRLQGFAAAQSLALAQVQGHHVRRWAATLHGEGAAPRTVAIALSAWRGLYRWMGREKLVAANPADGIRAPKAPKPLPKALAVDQAMALADLRREDAAAEPRLEARDRCIVELLYGCGLRVAELCALDARPAGDRPCWIDAAAGEAHLVGKGSKARSVPVGAAALRALEAWLALREALARPGEPALFVNRRGTRLSASQVRTRLAERAQQAGLPTHVHPHMLRHSYASHLLQSSGDLRAVQELLGHASISTTQVYTRLDFQHLAKTYDAAHPRAKRR
ncbi:MAG TPA: tyrosine recombinase XerC [Methylibium sp.]|uniref:tyrosine recombinase XerC n=1 Tax=Methylibium sp. TaxID=2067992 RepID=UPI002DBF19D2|nr:tyrosine recombinase XerC [Methylibium sp.]HEU4457897.1 tyrosine recombinase XerC [Methylibium sp.]